MPTLTTAGRGVRAAPPSVPPGFGGCRVSERQTGHRLSNSGWRSATCSSGERSLDPLGSPKASICRARGGSGRPLSGAACGEHRMWACRRRGAAAHPPHSQEAHHHPPPRAAGTRDLKIGAVSSDLRTRFAELRGIRAPSIAGSGGWGET